MHIAPFHFTLKNEDNDLDFMGYLKYELSRRNKQLCHVHINVGAGNEHVTDLQPTYDLEKNQAYFERSYEEEFAEHLTQYDLDGEYFFEGAYSQWQDDKGEFSRTKFKEFLAKNGATLRFW